MVITTSSYLPIQMSTAVPIGYHLIK